MIINNFYNLNTFISPLFTGNYSVIMNVEYQELINVTLWQKGSK